MTKSDLALWDWSKGRAVVSYEAVSRLGGSTSVRYEFSDGTSWTYVTNNTKYAASHNALNKLVTKQLEMLSGAEQLELELGDCGMLEGSGY